jgi:hypothetical protein
VQLGEEIVRISEAKVAPKDNKLRTQVNGKYNDTSSYNENK